MALSAKKQIVVVSDDIYVQSYFEEHFEESEEKCPCCGKNVMKNTGTDWIKETYCRGCGVFRDEVNPGKEFSRPRQCRPIICY